jgi:hypothetical protein
VLSVGRKQEQGRGLLASKDGSQSEKKKKKKKKITEKIIHKNMDKLKISRS